jgi:hypothetical protein
MDVVSGELRVQEGRGFALPDRRAAAMLVLLRD